MGMFNFGYHNPADAAQPYLNQIPGKTNPYYQPYFDAGKSQLPGLQQQYGQLLNDPGGKYNSIGQSFHESPGFQFALQQALGSNNRGAAANGMAGSHQNSQEDMQLATQLGNQDYNNYMQGATNLYGQGLQGSMGLAGMGQQAGNNMAEMIAQTLAQQAQTAYTGQQNRNERNNGMFGNLVKGASALSAFTPWGQAGGAMSTAYDRFYGHGDR